MFKAHAFISLTDAFRMSLLLMFDNYLSNIVFQVLPIMYLYNCILKKNNTQKTKEKALGLDCFDEEIKTLRCTYTFIVANLTEQMIEAS